MKGITRRQSLRYLLQGAAGLALSSSTVNALAAMATKDEKSALIVVDVQNCFIDGGTLPVKNGAEVVPVINQLSTQFLNVVMTQDWHTKEHASFASTYDGKKPFETTELSYGTQVLWPDHCVQGTDDASLVAGLDIPHAEMIIRKGFHQHGSDFLLAR